MMVQDVQMKKRNRTGNGNRSDYIHRISSFRGRFGKSDYRLIGLIGGRSSDIVCQETAGRFYDSTPLLASSSSEIGMSRKKIFAVPALLRSYSAELSRLVLNRYASVRPHSLRETLPTLIPLLRQLCGSAGLSYPGPPSAGHVLVARVPPPPPRVQVVSGGSGQVR